MLAKCTLGIPLLFLLAVSVPLAAGPAVSFDNGTLRIETERYAVAWRDGRVVSLRTRLPQKMDLTILGVRPQSSPMPVGLGSLYGHVGEARRQHHPWSFAPATTAFPAQHPPHSESEVAFEALPDGARLTYRGLRGEPEAILVQELRVDEKTGDLVIRQRGTSPNPGLFGIAFSLDGLRPDIEWAVPYFGGQRWNRAFSAGRLVTVGWPQFWSAGLIIGEVPGGGSLAVWAEDAAMRPKYLRFLHDGSRQALGFQANAEAPYTERKAVEVCAWRLNTFAGSWLEPARRYRDWMVDTWRLVPRSEREPQWAFDVALIWPSFANDAALRQMAEVFDPAKTVLMHWGWLRGFNRRIPEYVPSDPKLAEKVAAARKLGYHVGGYTSMALVDQETHPDMMRAYGLDYQYHAPWQPWEKKTSWLVYVHPGSEAWRRFYAGKMAWVHATHGLDFLYQDVSGCGTGSSGRIEGRSFRQAVVACEDAIRKRLPQVALAGEFWNEVNVCREDFGLTNFLRWNPGQKFQGQTHRELLSSPGQPHPLLSFLFSDFCVYWPHQVPVRDTLLFHQDQNINEVIGAVPVWNTTPDDRVGEARVVLERARLWADGFRPWFPNEWDEGVVGYLRSRDGAVVKYRQRGRSRVCVRSQGGDERLVYARVTGETRFESDAPVQIDGWVAYGPRGPIGLDLGQWYCVFPGRDAVTPVTVVRLPDGAWVEGTRVTEGWCLVQFGGKAKGTIAWDVQRPVREVRLAGKSLPIQAREAAVAPPADLLFIWEEPVPLKLGASLDIAAWKHHIVSQGRILREGSPMRKGVFKVANLTRQGVMVHPPLGGRGSEYAIDALVRLPDAPRLALKTVLGTPGGSGDGVRFVVRVNGREVWRRHRKTEAAWDAATIDLTKHAGETVVLSLAVDCGPSGFNTSCDASIWAETRLVAP